MSHQVLFQKMPACNETRSALTDLPVFYIFNSDSGEARPCDELQRTVHHIPSTGLFLINTLINAAIDLSDPDIFVSRDETRHGGKFVVRSGEEKK